jgi:hypothetical protein
MAEYARRIEEREDDAEPEAIGRAQPDQGELPDPQAMVDELERFLREQRGDG